MSWDQFGRPGDLAAIVRRRGVARSPITRSVWPPRARSAGPPLDSAPAASACEAYRELIVAAVAKGRDAKASWQDLVDDHGFTHKYASVKRFVARLRETPTVEARPVITTAPGDEAHVDYGEGPMVNRPGFPGRSKA